MSPGAIAVEGIWPVFFASLFHHVFVTQSSRNHMYDGFIITQDGDYPDMGARHNFMHATACDRFCRFPCRVAARILDRPCLKGLT